MDRLWYRRDRRGYVDEGYTHLFVVPAEGGTARQLTDGDWNHQGVAWTPDGEEVPVHVAAGSKTPNTSGASRTSIRCA